MPPFDGFRVREALRAQIRLAQELGCGIDLHIDESDAHPAAGLKQLLAVEQEERRSRSPAAISAVLGWPPAASANASVNGWHGSIKVVALPLTNAWLLGRRPGDTPVTRPLAPIRRRSVPASAWLEPTTLLIPGFQRAALIHLP